ncbi:NAD(P)-dependent oxidoreductase [Candidatus Poriferisodalis sp.]|uniref:NAD(P)-dependent oxidoreductase n=1 Tax=Candidatus Poriferisodalis sp. TaxID=3101277 RepID=UPI003B01C4AE
MSGDAVPAGVAFIGLGVMGYPMAGHLAAAGHRVTVFNRTGAVAQRWAAEHHGTVADTPAQAAEGAQFVFVCVGADDDVRAVVHDRNGTLSAMGSPAGAAAGSSADSAVGSPEEHPAGGGGAMLVDHTTASAGLARELAAACARRGVGFLDAPVSGGEAGARNGVLTVMCGGEAGDFERARPVMDAYARAVTLIGPAGSGQLAKMVNQICIAGLVQALSEGLEFGRRAGLDLDAVLSTISQGAAGSWQMSNRGATMTADEFDFGFAVDWMRKDLGIVLAEAQHNGAPLPVTALVDQFYKRVQELGGGRWDTSSLIALLRPSS